MPDYKRLVAYIYQYTNGSKAKNLGFARIESRNGQCRIVISIRGLRSNRQDIYKVYTFVRKENQMAGIPVGELRSQNGRGTATLTVSPDNIQESGYSLDQIGGIVITDNSNGFYATEWDDKPVVVREFVVLGTQTESSKVVSIDSRRQKSQEQQKSQEKPKPQELPKAQEQQKSQSQAKPDRQEQVKEQEQPRPKPQEHAKIQGQPKPQELPKPKPQEHAKGQEQPKPQEQIESQGQTKPKGQCSIENRYKSREENWKELQKTYPRVLPFEDDNFADCIRIEPKDLVHLPKEYWILGNNSFLLHGYYNYRYLVLGKIKNGEGYLLGIPGTFDNREQRMARMFGFPDFIPAKKEGQKTGKFGYWCRKV